MILNYKIIILMIKRVKILGQRCSGTNYLQCLCEKNYSGVDVCGVTDIVWKHKLFEPTSSFNDCLFIVILRNPFDYLRSFHASPTHDEPHRRNKLTLEQFLKCRWNAYDDGYVYPNGLHNKGKLIESFDNIMKMREQKIKAWLNCKNKLKNIVFLRYEDLKKSKDVLKILAQKYNIKCKDTLLDVDRHRGSGPKYKEKKYPDINSRTLEIMKNGINWELENKFLYKFEDYKV
jgi:hypothetical protein